MMKTVFPTNVRKFLTVGCIAATALLQAQTVIYQQNFDGNNGTFANTLISQNTATNGWVASSTAAQYGNYRHVWNISDVTSGGNANVLPITGKSLGIGFWNGNEPNVPNQYFRTWDGEEPASGAFYTTRWANVGISTLGYENITIEFKWRCVGEVDAGTVYDYGTINTSIDGGASWLMDQSAGQGGVTSEQGTFNKGLYFGNANVQTATLTLPANRANQANFRLAFRMVVDEGYGTGGGFIVDDIIVRGTALLATANVDKANMEVHRDGADFVVKSSSAAINKIEIYDASGKLAITSAANGKEVRIAANLLRSGVYILKAQLNNGEELTKKIRK